MHRYNCNINIKLDESLTIYSNIFTTQLSLLHPDAIRSESNITQDKEVLTFITTEIATVMVASI